MVVRSICDKCECGEVSDEKLFFCKCAEVCELRMRYRDLFEGMFKTLHATYLCAMCVGFDLLKGNCFSVCVYGELTSTL